MLLTSAWQLDILLLLAVVIYFINRYFSKAHHYWAKRGVPTPPSLPILGHFLDVALFRTTIAEWLKKYYDMVNEKYFGLYIFDEPFFVVKDPELVKLILIKDFSNFPDRNAAAPKHDVLQQNILFFKKNPDWRYTRSKLAPVFSTGRMKSMFHLIDESGVGLRNWVNDNLGVFDAKEMTARYSTNVIAKCAFGIDPECFIQEKPPFREVGRKFFDFTLRNGISQTSYFLKPSWVDYFKLDFIEKKCLDYFEHVFIDTLNKRNTENQCNDLLDFLKGLQNDKEFSRDGLVDLQLAGVAIQFFLAGFETTSATIAFTLYEYCMNPDIQNRAREEVQKILGKHQGKLTYDALKEMTYLEMCLQETTRKYPVLPFLDRKCVKDYKIPGTDFIIEKGTAVFIPMYGLQMDEKYFPEPFKYDPERFQNKNEYNNGLYYIPFGGGPRICIGERFGRISTKIALLYVLANFELEKCDQTPDPIHFEPKSFFLASTVGLPMRFNALKL